LIWAWYDHARLRIVHFGRKTAVPLFIATVFYPIAAVAGQGLGCPIIADRVYERITGPAGWKITGFVREGVSEVVGCRRRSRGGPAKRKTGRQAVEFDQETSPGVVVMDIAMPLLNGLEATRQIRKAFPDTKVVILSAAQR